MIRFDNRDSGQSTPFSHAGIPDFAAMMAGRKPQIPSALAQFSLARACAFWRLKAQCGLFMSACRITSNCSRRMKTASTSPRVTSARRTSAGYRFQSSSTGFRSSQLEPSGEEREVNAIAHGLIARSNHETSPAVPFVHHWRGQRGAHNQLCAWLDR